MRCNSRKPMDCPQSRNRHRLSFSLADALHPTHILQQRQTMLPVTFAGSHAWGCPHVPHNPMLLSALAGSLNFLNYTSTQSLIASSDLTKLAATPGATQAICNSEPEGCPGAVKAAGGDDVVVITSHSGEGRFSSFARVCVDTTCIP